MMLITYLVRLQHYLDAHQDSTISSCKKKKMTVNNILAESLMNVEDHTQIFFMVIIIFIFSFTISDI